MPEMPGETGMRRMPEMNGMFGMHGMPVIYGECLEYLEYLE